VKHDAPHATHEEPADEPKGEDALRPRPSAPEDVAEALRFVHLVEAQTRARLSELAVNVNALVEALIEGGQLSFEAFDKRRRLAVVYENERSAGEVSVQISGAPDKYAMIDAPIIDCSERLSLCKARCCALPFTLSAQDLDERIVRWDYARPYVVAQRDDGLCVHNREGACSVYEARPASCRAYDCRRDRRIWLDFERRIPAP